jgi:O-antigen ligase
MNLAIGIWIIYVIGHFALNFYAPYRPLEFSFNNFIKHYVRTAAPLLALFWFVRRPDAIRVPRNYLNQIAWLLLIGLSLNLVIRGVGMMLGIQYTGANLGDDEAASYFTVPVINAAENIYALRGLSPIAVLFSFASLTARRKNAVPAQRLILWLIFFGALVGSVLSGGRATVVVCAGMVIITLLLRKRIGLLAAALAMALIFVGVVNLFAAQINRTAPLAVQRTLQWVLVEKSPEASESIQGSSKWRYELFRRSIAEWKSDPRIFWFGRATYVFNTQDLIARGRNPYEAGLESSLRRGFTHNLITEQLVVFGLIGFILYSCVVVSISFFLLGVWRSARSTPDIKNLALIALTLNTVTFVIALVGGGGISVTLAWLIIILIARIHQVSALEASQPSVPELVTAGGEQSSAFSTATRMR